MLLRAYSVVSLLVLAASCLLFAVATSRERRDIGTPGVDYPTYSEVPPGLTFGCNDKVPGYYADPEAQCQVWHWCVATNNMFSFLCPNGTLFSQIHRVCDWWFNVDCSGSSDHYSINRDLPRHNPETQAEPVERLDPVKEDEEPVSGEV